MHRLFVSFAYETFTLCGWSFQYHSARKNTCDPVQPSPYTSQPPAPEGVGFRLFRVRSPLLTESLLMSLPPGTKMFQFPGYASPSYVFGCVISRTNFKDNPAVIETRKRSGFAFHISKNTGSHPKLVRDGLSHSEIPGSKSAWRLPEAYRSLLRPSSLAQV